MSQIKKRNGYIDVIKFLFALIVTDFHVNTGTFPGGRIVVEGFFMISGYLMMHSIRRNKFPEDSLGVSTVRFIYQKFKGLFLYLFPAVIISYVLTCIRVERPIGESLERVPLLVFDFFPLREAGFKADYVLGISWYLSAMFLALAVLYPLCKKYRTSVTLIVCPISALLIYGALSHYYGHMAIATDFLGNSWLSSGLLRGFAGCAAGCTLYEICDVLSGKKVTLTGRAFFTILEIIGFAFFFYVMSEYPKSRYDYILIFVIFLLLVIGIGGISFSSLLTRGKYTKFFGTASTLIVLLHYSLNVFFVHLFGDGYHKTSKFNLYLITLAGVCLVVWFWGVLAHKVMTKLSGFASAKFWRKES